MDLYKCYNTESDEAVVTAARTLVSIKYSKLDQDTARKLQEITRMRPRDESQNQKSPIKTNLVSKKMGRLHEDIKKKSKSRKSNHPSSPPSAIDIRPPMPELQELIGLCSRPVEKRIMPSDVNRGLSRLLLNSSPVKDHLLPMLDPNHEEIKNGIPVTVYGPEGGEYALTFKIWSKKFYVLKGPPWNSFCLDYELKSLIGHWSTVWMFRHNRTNGLCFAITLKKNNNITPPLAAAQHNEIEGNSRKRPAQPS